MRSSTIQCRVYSTILVTRRIRARLLPSSGAHGDSWASEAPERKWVAASVCSGLTSTHGQSAVGFAVMSDHRRRRPRGRAVAVCRSVVWVPTALRHPGLPAAHHRPARRPTSGGVRGRSPIHRLHTVIGSAAIHMTIAQHRRGELGFVFHRDFSSHGSRRHAFCAIAVEIRRG
jgi:hypothetical protein